MQNQKFLEDVWSGIRESAQRASELSALASPLISTFVTRQKSFADSLCAIVSAKLSAPYLKPHILNDEFRSVGAAHQNLLVSAARDLVSIVERDPACGAIIEPFLFSKGYHALQAHRFAHVLWKINRRTDALLIQSRCSEAFGVDIHPAAVIGSGVFIDHGTAVVIGETTVIEDDVSILQSVTLGGTGKEHGDRHPKVRSGVLIGAGATILGNIEIGEAAQVGAGSVVLKPVGARTTVAGVPAVIVGKPDVHQPALEMRQQFQTPIDGDRNRDSDNRILGS